MHSLQHTHLPLGLLADLNTSVICSDAVDSRLNQENVTHPLSSRLESNWAVTFFKNPVRSLLLVEFFLFCFEDADDCDDGIKNDVSSLGLPHMIQIVDAP